jgi:uncharacterized protein YegL
MTDPNVTEIVAILDRSGSMGTLIAETIGGFNNFVEEQKKTDGKAILTLVQFDDQYQIDYEGVDVNDVKPLDEKTYVPRGMTALLDAVGKTIVSVGERLSHTEEEKRPGQVVFLIITDGMENSSQEYKADKVKEMVKHQTDKYNWSFVFMGGGDIDSQKDQIDQGMALGINAANAYAYSANTIGTANLYANVSKGVSRMRRAASAGRAFSSSDSLLTDEEKNNLITPK